MDKEQINHQAYMDVLDLNEPSMPDCYYYMECYRFWLATNPVDTIWEAV